MCEVNFYRGEKSGRTFNRGNFWNFVKKRCLSVSLSLQKEILGQLGDTQYIHIIYIYIYIYIYMDFQLWLKRYWPLKWQNIRNIFRFSFFSVNNNGGSNSSSINYCFCIERHITLQLPLRVFVLPLNRNILPSQLSPLKNLSRAHAYNKT